MLMNARYHKVAVILHWVMALLIIGLITLGYFLEDIPREYQGYMWHKSFGLMVLLLSFFRLYWRLTHTAPPYPDAMKPAEKKLAKIGVVAFYALIIIMPLSGWLMVSASMKYPTILFGLTEIPHLPFPEDTDTKALAKSFNQVHELSTLWVGIGLIALHVGAVAKHYFIDKVNLISRMRLS